MEKNRFLFKMVFTILGIFPVFVNGEEVPVGNGLAPVVTPPVVNPSPVQNTPPVGEATEPAPATNSAISGHGVAHPVPAKPANAKTTTVRPTHRSGPSEKVAPMPAPATVAPPLFQGSERITNPAFGSFVPIEEDKLFKNIDYPELQVVPRASERLIYEAQNERNSKLSFFWTLQLPALGSMVAGLMAYHKYSSSTLDDKYKTNHDLACMASVGVGVFWFGLDYYLMASEPYNEAVSRINKIKKTDKKSDLMRERIAEEAMEKTARTMKTLNTISVVSNSIFTFGTMLATEPELRPLLLLPLALTFTPLIFSQKYSDIFEKHIEYKRKIYAPLSFFDLRMNSKTGNWEPMTGLVWNF